MQIRAEEAVPCRQTHSRADGRTDRHNEAVDRCSQFCKRANKTVRRVQWFTAALLTEGKFCWA